MMQEISYAGDQSASNSFNELIDTFLTSIACAVVTAAQRARLA